MERQVAIRQLDGVDTRGWLIDIPDACPKCHNRVVPNFYSAYSNDRSNQVQAVFGCTSQKCQEIFIGTYAHMGRHPNKGGEAYRLRSVAPRSPVEANFPSTVCELSPTFIEIYNQVQAAEGAELTQLVGIGLRKALEFLIKDFAVHQNPEDQEKIRGTLLANCINTYVQDVNIKECAKRAAWLGNDETHYTRKWEDRDVDDLKLLVRLTTNWIDSALLTQKYIAEMPQPPR